MTAPNFPIPEGFRLLQVGEIVQAGDYATWGDAGGFHDTMVKNSIGKEVSSTRRVWYFRPIPPPTVKDLLTVAPECGACDDTRQVDSGGQNPDGSWINRECPDCAPAPAVTQGVEDAEQKAFIEWRNSTPYEASPSMAVHKGWMARAALESAQVSTLLDAVTKAREALNHSLMCFESIKVRLQKDDLSNSDLDAVYSEAKEGWTEGEAAIKALESPALVQAIQSAKDGGK